MRCTMRNVAIWQADVDYITVAPGCNFYEGSGEGLDIANREFNC